MSDIAIQVEHLGKQYKLGGRQAGNLTFRESMVETIKTPLRWIKGQRQAQQTTFWALDDVSFEVRQGEAVGIIGRNGAGKSTLLKILSRITKPTRGRVDIYGRVGSLLEVGTGFHPELSGRENIYLNGAILGMSRTEIIQKFDEIVDFAEVDKFLDTPVKFYSSGMYVRLAFAVAAHLDPEILVVDEVLAVGDAEFQRKCLGKMSAVAQQGRTVIFVSHNMGAIESLCQKCILLKNGSIAANGNIEDVVNAYLSSSKQEVTTPVSLRTDRHGTGRLFFEDIKIEDGKIRDRSLRVDLTIQNQCKQEFKNVILSIVLLDHLGRPLSNLVNYIIDKPIFVGADGAKIKITMNNINLVPGIYGVSPFLSSDTQNGEIFDWVSWAARFEIPDYDYYHKGHIPYIKGDTIYMDYDYEIF